MSFFSRNSRPDRRFSPVGTGEETLYSEELVNGKRVLVPNGKRNVNEFIQASLDDTLVYNILERFNRGDLSALNRVDGGQFMDVIGMPTSLAQAQQMLIDINNKFYDLPVDIRQKFDNNVDTFIDRVSNRGVDALLDAGLIVKQPAENVKGDKIKKDGEVNVTE